MRFRIPKPLHGWREFAGEVGVIVLGVLIALGAGQVVGWLHDRQVAEEARQNVRAEAKLDLGFIQARIDAERCIEARLAELSMILGNAGEGSLIAFRAWSVLPSAWADVEIVKTVALAIPKANMCLAVMRFSPMEVYPPTVGRSQVFRRPSLGAKLNRPGRHDVFANG